MISHHKRVGLTIDIQLTRNVVGKDLWQVGILGQNNAVGVFDIDLQSAINRATEAFLRSYPEELPSQAPLPTSPGPDSPWQTKSLPKGLDK